MKSVFSLLMSVYVLLLSVLPCTDVGLPIRDSNQPTQVTADHHTHDTDRPVGDQCSPFCSCTCCGTVGVQSPVFAFDFAEPQPVAHSVPTLTPAFLPSVALSTWQPPQLS